MLCSLDVTYIIVEDTINRDIQSIMQTIYTSSDSCLTTIDIRGCKHATCTARHRQTVQDSKLIIVRNNKLVHVWIGDPQFTVLFILSRAAAHNFILSKLFSRVSILYETVGSYRPQCITMSLFTLHQKCCLCIHPLTMTPHQHKLNNNWIVFHN